ncbi:hypothetical protein E4U55_004195 [Claviceps digitariae]|nr:hypothetical protein E4U55_004195 [Claviceps digitariae]
MAWQCLLFGLKLQMHSAHTEVQKFPESPRMAELRVFVDEDADAASILGTLSFFSNSFGECRGPILR